MTNTVSKTIQGLQPGGNYVIQVRSKNGTSDKSEWSQALNYSAPLVSASNGVKNNMPTYYSQGSFGNTLQPTLIVQKQSHTNPQAPQSPTGYVLGVLDAFQQPAGTLMPYELTLQIPAMNTSGTQLWTFVFVKNTAIGSATSSAVSGTLYSKPTSDSYGFANTAVFVVSPSTSFTNAIVSLYTTSGITDQIAFIDIPGPQFLKQTPAPIGYAYNSGTGVSSSSIFFIDTGVVTPSQSVTGTISYYSSALQNTIATQNVLTACVGGGNCSGLTFTAFDFNPSASPSNYFCKWYVSPDSTFGGGKTLDIIGASGAPITFMAKPIFLSNYNSPNAY